VQLREIRAKKGPGFIECGDAPLSEQAAENRVNFQHFPKVLDGSFIRAEESPAFSHDWGGFIEGEDKWNFRWDALFQG
jgi:hypothetical protein